MSMFSWEENSTPTNGVFGPLLPCPFPVPPLQRTQQDAPQNIMTVGRQDWSEKEKLHNKVNTLMFDKINLLSELDKKNKEIKELNEKIKRYEEIGCKVAEAHLMFLGLAAKPGGGGTSTVLWQGVLQGTSATVPTAALTASCTAAPICSALLQKENTKEQATREDGSGCSVDSDDSAASDFARMEELD